MYRLTITWSDNACSPDESTHPTVAKAGDYLADEGRRAREAELAHRDGEPMNETYTVDFKGEEPIRILSATLTEEDDDE